MKGTEKQIKWANSIKKDYYYTHTHLMQILNKYKEMFANTPVKKNLIDDLITELNKVYNNDSAKFWIDEGNPDNPARGYGAPTKGGLINELGDASIIASPQIQLQQLMKLLNVKIKH